MAPKPSADQLDNIKLTFENDSKRAFTNFLSDPEVATNDAIGSNGRYVMSTGGGSDYMWGRHCNEELLNQPGI